MSGLGTTIQPEGEPGNITHPVPLQGETTPDQPQQISQTTAIQTLDQLLHGNWIYDSTFTVSTSMPAGTIVYMKPIHPYEWNWPNRIVSKMFNSWTGSGKIRFRPLATAWYGGSIRVGFLPPNLAPDAIRSLPLEILTSYPNRDIDPKNTGWIDFRGPDQREIAYHYMEPFDGTKRQNFGGYVVFYVAGKLVTQAAEFTTIQFVVETAGDFMYDQPGPHALDDVEDSRQPLGSALDYRLYEQPLCDSMESGRYNAIQILPSTVTSLRAGGIDMRYVGGGEAYGVIDNRVPSLTITAPYRHFVGDGASSTWTQRMPKLPDQPTTDDFIPLSTGSGNIIPHLSRMAPTSQFNTTIVGLPTAGTEFSTLWHWENSTKLIGSTDTAVLAFKRAPGTSNAEVRAAQAGEITFGTNTSGILNPIDVTNVDSGLSLSPLASGESIVVFANLATRSFSPQTTIMGRTMRSWPQNESTGTTSWLYNIINTAGTPIGLIRLNANGMFTTNPVTSPVLFAASSRLRFFGTLPIDTPLPPATFAARSYRVAAYQIARSKHPLNKGCDLLSDEADMY